MKKSKLYAIRTINLGALTNLRKITFVCRQKEFYHKNTIGIWWKKSYGLGIIGEPNKQLKYFMFGVSFIGVLLWADFKWVGRCEKEQKLKMKDI